MTTSRTRYLTHSFHGNRFNNQNSDDYTLEKVLTKKERMFHIISSSRIIRKYDDLAYIRQMIEADVSSKEKRCKQEIKIIAV